MVYVADLPESCLDTGEFLFCGHCLTKSAASRGDYFWMPKDEGFTCPTCSEPMALAVSHSVISIVKQ